MNTTATTSPVGGAGTAEQRAAARKDDLALIWRHTHGDFKGKLADGTKSVLALRAGGTCLVPLNALTDAEVAERMPYCLKLEHGRLTRKLARSA